MSQPFPDNGLAAPAAGPFQSSSQAKTRLLAWADECDARTLKSRSSLGTIATSGALAMLSGLAVARVLTVRSGRSAPGSLVKTIGKQVISGALVARAGAWLLPHVIKALRNRSNSRAPS